MREAVDLDVHLPGIAGGDTRAYGAFLAGAEPVVRRSLRGFAAAVDVEAVLQETFLRVWQVAPRCEPDGRDNALCRLALRIAKNLAIDEVRRRREVEVPQGHEVGTDPVLPDPFVAARIAGCFELLPPQPRSALRARLDSDGAEPDLALAARLGMRTNTFFQNLARARSLLSQCLERQGIGLGSRAGVGR